MTGRCRLRTLLEHKIDSRARNLLTVTPKIIMGNKHDIGNEKRIADIIIITANLEPVSSIL